MARRKNTDLMSLREYAASRKARKLSGGSHTAVRKAIESGRLVESVRMGSKGQPLIDAAIADREWDARTDPTQQRDPAAPKAKPDKPKQAGLFGEEPPRPSDGPSGDETVSRARRAQAAKLEFQAKLTELEYRRQAKQLVPIEVVDREITRIVRECVTELREIPDRTCAHLAATNDAHRAKMLLASAIDLALERLTKAQLKLEDPES